MQKLTVLLTLIAILASGCSAPASTPTPPPPATTGTSLFENVDDVPVTESAPMEAVTGQVTPGVLCKNPLYPVHNGAWWMYDLSEGSRPSLTMSVGSDNAFTITVQRGNSTSKIEGQCTGEGIILLDASGVAAAYFSASDNSTLTFQNVKGITLPNNVQIGDGWSQTISIMGGNLNAVIETTYTAIGYERITTPAGSFDALKIEQNGSMNMGGQAVSTHAFLWYAPDIGMVKSVMDGVSSSELLAYNFP
jgi:hypothetical protein